ncbi:25847_t:CDS:1, partial [Racocetra persica]
IMIMNISGKENTSQRISVIFLQQIFESVDLSQQSSPTNTMVIDSIAGLICDQKYTLLYNVQQPFEVPMTEFDDEWWPLVTNIW